MEELSKSLNRRKQNKMNSNMQDRRDSNRVNRDHSPSVNGVGISSQNQHPAGRRCLYCGQFAPLVWVHGHGQCSCCGINVDECCRGESCSFG